MIVHAQGKAQAKSSETSHLYHRSILGTEGACSNQYKHSSKKLNPLISKVILLDPNTGFSGGKSHVMQRNKKVWSIQRRANQQKLSLTKDSKAIKREETRKKRTKTQQLWQIYPDTVPNDSSTHILFKCT